MILIVAYMNPLALQFDYSRWSVWCWESH